MMMWLNSEISGSVGGRSTYFEHDHHVDHENSHRQYHLEYSTVNQLKNGAAIQEPTDRSYGFSSYRDQCQTDDDFPGSAWRAPKFCLYTRIQKNMSGNGASS